MVLREAIRGLSRAACETTLIAARLSFKRQVLRRIRAFMQPARL